MNKLDIFYERGIIKRVDKELLYYLYALGFQVDGLLINLKILSSSKFFDKKLFERKVEEYYSLFTEFNVLLNIILYEHFYEELILLKDQEYEVRYEAPTGKVLLKLKNKGELK